MKMSYSIEPKNQSQPKRSPGRGLTRRRDRLFLLTGGWCVAICLTGLYGSDTLCAMQDRRSAPRICFILIVKVFLNEGQAVVLLRAYLSLVGLGVYTRDPIL